MKRRDDAAVLTMLRSDAELAEQALREYLSEDDAQLKKLLDAQRYSTFAGGKRIRPALVLEFCRLFGGDERAALPYAAAVELMHTYSLIHDDLPCMDDDDLRRGKPTCHVAFGEATALLAGDALLARAFEIAARNQHCGRAAEAVAELARSAGSFGMIGGQFLDLCGEEHALDFNTIMRMYRLKTGALIIASARLGCIAAGLDREDARSRAAAVYAENVGLTFQIIDDLLDLIGSTELLGKATQKDAARGKTTIMSCLSPEEAKKYAAGLTGAAVASIAGYPGSDLLSALAYYLLERES
ncbi:MAG: polyprenyl synthetase family protein [Eubacteriales bacterium]